MHLATYTRAEAGKLLAHYERSIGERDHIDRGGTVYNLAPEYDGGQRARFQALTDGIKVTGQTRPLADLVVTKPRGYQGDTREFFEAAYSALAERVGSGRVVSAYVHMDEPGAMPHMHFAFVPVVETPVMTNDKSQPLRWTAADEKKNPAHRAGEVKRDAKGTVRYKRVQKLDADGRPVMKRTAKSSALFSREDMRVLHPWMEGELCRRLGVDHVGIALDESDDRRKLSGLSHPEYVRVTGEIERSRGELAQARGELARTAEEIEEVQQELDRAIETGVELARASEGLARERDRIDEEVRRIVEAKKKAEAQAAEAEAARESLAEEAARESERLERLRRGVEDAERGNAARAGEIGEVREATAEVRREARAAAGDVVANGRRIRGLRARIDAVRGRISAIRGHLANHFGGAVRTVFATIRRPFGRPAVFGGAAIKTAFSEPATVFTPAAGRAAAMRAEREAYAVLRARSAYGDDGGEPTAQAPVPVASPVVSHAPTPVPVASPVVAHAPAPAPYRARRR